MSKAKETSENEDVILSIRQLVADRPRVTKLRGQKDDSDDLPKADAVSEDADIEDVEVDEPEKTSNAEHGNIGERIVSDTDINVTEMGAFLSNRSAKKTAAPFVLSPDMAAEAIKTDVIDDNLRNIVKEMLHEEFQGSLDITIKRKLRKIIRSEVKRALNKRDPD